jgi:hypothetical protein
LKPPPSLAARYAGAPSTSSPADASAPQTGDRKVALQEIAKELREILKLLDESDAEVKATRSKK